MDCKVIEILHQVPCHSSVLLDAVIGNLFITLGEFQHLLPPHEPGESQAEVDLLDNAVVQVHGDLVREEVKFISLFPEDARVGSYLLIFLICVEEACGECIQRNVCAIFNFSVADVAVVLPHIFGTLNLPVSTPFVLACLMLL